MTETPNYSAKDPQQIIVELQRKLAERTAERDDLLQQQTATADVLKVISRSAFDLQTVLETLVRSAVDLSGAFRGTIYLRDGDLFRFKAASYDDINPAWLDFLKNNPQRAGRHSAAARAIATGQTISISDLLADPEIQMPANAFAGVRAVLAAPLLRDGRVQGVMVLSRPSPGPFTQRQIELVQIFADQAVVAIHNTHLFNETKEALERQTATADILKVIAGSPTNVQPVFQAIASSANRLIGGFSTAVFRFVDGVAHLASFTPTTPEADEVLLGSFPRPIGMSSAFKASIKGEVVQIADTEASQDQTRNSRGHADIAACCSLL